MSATTRALARSPSRALPWPALATAISLPLLAGLLLRTASLAEPQRSAIRIDPDAARRAGIAYDLVPHPELPVAVVELRRPPGRDGDTPADVVATVLDVSADSSLVALTEEWGPGSSALVLAAADQSQLRIPLSGLLAATFAPDGSWVAALDGTGQLWRIEAAEGEQQLVNAGPFVGPLVVEPDGSVLALAVSSVEAPATSKLVRVAPDGMQTAPLADEELVYGTRPLADGSLAVVAHRPDGTLLLTLGPGAARRERPLGIGAVNVAVSADGSIVAWERDGRVVVSRDGSPPETLAEGRNPRLATDGSALLIDTDHGAALLSPAGAVLAELPSAVALVECGGCRP